MARNINTRLKELRVRRAGTDRLDRLAADAQISVLAKSMINESWQERAASNQPYTRYAIGAMQAVDADYTRVSLETAERVGKQLDAALTREGFSVDFRLQGSVPLDVHIRGVSDVDLLNLDISFFTYNRYGPLSLAGGYTGADTPRTSVGVLKALRSSAAKALRNAYPAADIDTSGSKAIKISGGSLARPVDVVPSHWHDNEQYQKTRNEIERTVTILDKNNETTIDNLPFVHIARVRARCDLVGGGVRKGIRLAKNVKADAIKEGTSINLPSFDIAAIMYHADQTALRVAQWNELAILAETQRHFDALATNHAHAKTLMVPDGSRVIFDTSAKLQALNTLSTELDDLALEVAKEQNASYRLYTPSLAQSREELAKGMGLGLAIARRLARLIGSEVTLNSIVGRGSVFRFSLPLAQAGTEAEATGTHPRPSHRSVDHSPVSRHILVIDDDETIRVGLSALLRQVGYSVDAAETIAEAEASAHRQSPYLLICDSRLRADETGAEAARRLRAQLGGRVPAILITGDTHPDRIAEAAREDMEILYKPTSPDQLLDLIARLAPNI